MKIKQHSHWITVYYSVPLVDEDGEEWKGIQCFIQEWLEGVMEFSL